jgi:hypothetical protein
MVMAQIDHAFAEVDVLLRDRQYDDAKLLLARHLEQNPSDREAKLYLLLADVHQSGPLPFEDEIDALRTLENLAEREKDILRQIFVLGFKSAEHDGREEQALIYQRLLRRLLLNQSLDQAIPRTRYRRTSDKQTNGAIKSRGIFVELRTPAMLRSFLPAMAEASATAASALGHAWEKIHISRSPWQATSRAALGSISATRRVADGLRAGVNERMISLRAKSPDLFHRSPMPKSSGWKCRFRTPQVAIAAAAGLIALPLAYYLSLDHPSSEMAPEVTTRASPSQPNDSAVPLNTSPQTPDSNEPPPADSEPLGYRVTEHFAALRRTYTAALKKNPDLMGSLSLRIKMDAEGNVIGAEAARSRLSDSDFAETILAEAKKWRFLRHKQKGGVFTVPLLFVPNDMDPRSIVRWEQTFAEEDGKTNVIRPLKTAVESRNKTERTELVSHRRDTNVTSNGLAKNPPKTEERSAKLTEYKTRRLVPLRDEPRFSSSTTEHIGPGTPLSVLETKGDWLKIKTRSGGSVGYVRKEYLAPVNGAD